MELEALGWDEEFDQLFEEYRPGGLQPFRVCREHRERYQVLGACGELTAEVAGRLRFGAVSRADFPVVGDWVAVDAYPQDGLAIIHALLPRRTRFSRKAVLAGGPKYGPGKTDEQILAANVDTVFLVSGLDGDFNVRRVERYLSVAWDSGARPVVVLNKLDLCPDPAGCLRRAEAVAQRAPVHAISATSGSGLAVVRNYINGGKTCAFLGSSGVGKSTIINALLGEERLATREVRSYDNRGRHTTTHRELLLLPDGGLVIDTPGMREIQMWSDDQGLERTFEDIEVLSRQCRFSDCSHNTEPGCAIQQALATGSLDADRYGNYLRLLREARHLERLKNQAQARREQRERDRRYRQFHKMRKRLKDEGLM